jgi:hypothetical protein|tara:strand:+ start:357 stop:740 length:384 start_codon:yes stop_codon:yes gene_type:complete
MAFTYTYTVRNLKVRDEVNADGDTLTNAVVQTYWDITGTDEEGNTGQFTGATPFSAANVPAGSFTAFADLDEATVIGWITGVINGDAGYKAHIDTQIQKEIDRNIATEVAGEDLPWGEAAPAPADDI